MEKLIRFFKDEEGATMVEYALMVALIAVFALAAVEALGGSVSGAFEAIANAINGA